MLAGVNGAGKSSILGRHLQQAHGIPWFNPDAFARELMARGQFAKSASNAAAWQEGLRRLDQAIEAGADYAFETTLGGNTIPARIRAAVVTHDVFLWYCGLSSPELHLARVKVRVACGGHDIPEEKIRKRFTSAPVNLIGLMPHLTGLQIFDNSSDATPDGVIPDPVLVLRALEGELQYPDPGDAGELAKTPTWARPLVEAALRGQ